MRDRSICQGEGTRWDVRFWSDADIHNTASKWSLASNFFDFGHSYIRHSCPSKLEVAHWNRAGITIHCKKVRKMSGRDHIPNELQRTLMLEVGYRCPLCKATEPLEIEHIEEWAQVQKHEFSNMIVLCANCHRRKKNSSDPGLPPDKWSRI